VCLCLCMCVDFVIKDRHTHTLKFVCVMYCYLDLLLHDGQLV
jgi:hypothetical protein